MGKPQVNRCIVVVVGVGWLIPYSLGKECCIISSEETNLEKIKFACKILGKLYLYDRWY
jgi:hypothetical protein